MSYRRIEAFLSRSGDDVRNEDVYGTAGSDRHCPDLAKGGIKIDNGTMIVVSKPFLPSGFCRYSKKDYLHWHVYLQDHV